MTNWTIFLMLGVSAIWLALLSAVAYLVSHAPARAQRTALSAGERT